MLLNVAFLCQLKSLYNSNETIMYGDLEAMKSVSCEEYYSRIAFIILKETGNI